jgi:hypothetical protein
MPITKSPIDSIFRKPTTGIYIPLLNLNAVNPVKPIAAAIRRIFTPLLGSGSQHYTFNTVTLAGNFEVQADYCLSDLTVDNAIFGDTDSSGGDLLRINKNTSSMLIRIGGSTFTTTGSYTEDQKLNTVKMTRVGTTVKIFRNNVEIFSETIALVDFTLNMLGTRQNGAFDNFNGYIANFKATDVSTLVMDAPIDKQYSAADPIVINKADSSNNLTAINLNNAGSEFIASDDYGWIDTFNIWGQNIFAVREAWADNGDGTFTTDVENAATQIRNSFQIEEGTRILASYKLSASPTPAAPRIVQGNQIFQFEADNINPSVLFSAESANNQRIYFGGSGYALGIVISEITYNRVLEIAGTSE